MNGISPWSVDFSCGKFAPLGDPPSKDLAGEAERGDLAGELDLDDEAE